MKWPLALAALGGASAVAMAAFLRHAASGADLDAAMTAAHYQQIHSLALLALGLYALDKKPHWRLILPAALFAAGIALFSGGIYISAFGIWGGAAFLAPIGGMCLIAGWGSLIFLKNGAVEED